ncbi:MAG: helix-turn-helix transcriptional regulator [Candidatus Krumholzibacteriia bacterium]
MFGPYVRKMRVGRGETLRQFCGRAGMDPAYVSRIERGLLAPPQDQEKLEHYAEALGFAHGTAPWQEFMDLAATAAGRLPQDALENEQLMACLPAFLRTMRGQQVEDEELDQLIDLIRKGGGK